MLLQLGTPLLTGFSYTDRLQNYQTSTWSLGEKYIQEYNGWFQEQQTQFLLGRDDFSGFLTFMGHLSYQCSRLLGDKKMMSFLQNEHYDIAVLDAFNPCSFILARKLGIQYIAFYPGALNGPLSIDLSSPVSYVPIFNSQLTDHMNTWGRMKNLFCSLLTPVGHPKACVFITHGGQNSLLQAVYHSVPVLSIPLFGDQFDNVVKAEAKGLGLTIKPTHITRELLASTLQTLILDERYKSSALALSRLHRSQPVAPALTFVLWVNHILQAGVAGASQSSSNSHAIQSGQSKTKQKKKS
uniref:glucuronosyltransferase n=1 Tax=Knipowitschia caucasica TaxID=637954 RepID=A0AAV2MR01_KNICA